MALALWTGQLLIIPFDTKCLCPSTLPSTPNTLAASQACGMFPVASWGNLKDVDKSEALGGVCDLFSLVSLPAITRPVGTLCILQSKIEVIR